jgi:hypothetical protein
MFRWLWRLLYESTPAEFRSAFGIEESVERLRAATKRSVFSALSQTAAVGKVSEKSVRLQRVIPMVGNSFKPFFLGRFESREGKVLLVGRFTILPIIKVFMTFWFGMVTLGSVGLLFGLTSTILAPAVLGPFVMLGAGVAMVAFGKWLARNDVAWLSEAIENALESPGAVAARGMTTPIDPAAVPLTLKWAAIFLAASAAMPLLSGLAMPHLPAIPTQAGATPPFPPLGRWPLVYAALALVLSLGVWGRRPWAWWGFFVLLGGSAFWTMYAMQAIGNIGPPPAMRAVFAVMSCAAVALWGRWWYEQRRHFIWS